MGTGYPARLAELGLSPDTLPDRAQWHALLDTLGNLLGPGTGDCLSCEERVRAVLDGASERLFLLDQDGQYLDLLAGSATLSATLPAAALRTKLPIAATQQLTELVQTVLASGSAMVREYHFEAPDDARWVELKVAPAGLQVGDRRTVVAQLSDISERHRLERDTRLLSTVMQSAHEAMVVVDAQRRLLYANPAVASITGYSLAELHRRQQGFLLHECDEGLCEELCNEAHSGARLQREITLHLPDGGQRLVWLNLDTLRDAAGNIEYFVAMLIDVTEIKRSRAELEHVATHDRLTGLPNRALFEERLDQALSRARRQQTLGALLLLDVDRFKQINDSLGHQVGDELLREVATRLQHAGRMEDTVARLGGDEFTLILEDLADLTQAGRVAQKILKVLGRPMAIADLELIVTCSIGIAVFPHRGDDMAAEFLRQADTAMYEAKRRGGNQYDYYTEEMGSRAMASLEMESDLRRAIERGDVTVVYQPQYALRSGELIGLEVLARWHDPVRGQVPPAEFIAVAEMSGLIDVLGFMVLEQVAAQLAAWGDRGLEFHRVAINLSPRQLAAPDLVPRCASILEQHGISATSIELEITERVVYQEGGPSYRNLLGLHRLGFQFAIDDFGTGHSSMINLKRFPLARLKIDQSFIQDIDTNSNDEAIARATAALARELGLEVIAEGVERAGPAAILQGLDCHGVQGFLYARPMAAAEFEAGYARFARIKV